MSARVCGRLSRCGIVCVLWLAPAPAAWAQIYSWRDANGTLVLSDRRPTGVSSTEHVYAVPRTDAIRATRYAAPDRSRPFERLIDEHSRRQGVRPDLIRAVMQVESAFNPRARSPKGALGLMQLMPATLREFGVGDPFDPTDNVRAGVRYLRALLDRYGNDETLALAAYNAGPTAVDRHGQAVPPYRETQHYVAQITRLIGPRQAPTSGHRIYKITETIDGRTAVRYTNTPPTGGAFEVVARSSW
jgi:hypothetical protein